MATQEEVQKFAYYGPQVSILDINGQLALFKQLSTVINGVPNQNKVLVLR